MTPMQGFLINCIAYFGNGGHPEPNADTLQFFGKGYIRDCVNKAMASGKLNMEAQRLGALYLEITACE